MWIEIDDDLAEQLESHMLLNESRDDVIRRLLLQGIRASLGRNDNVVPVSGHRTRVVRSGSVVDLLRAGLVAAGDEVEYRQVRQGVTHTATIEPDGQLRTSRGSERSPSAALQALVGFSINGWKSWTHRPTGKSLSALRDELPR